MATPDRSARGRFITFEGGEGAGKSTQVRLLAQALREAGISVDETREPGGSEIAERVRDFLLSGQAKEMGPVAETFLFNAARYDHVRARIAPALEKGTWVLCDRFADSSRIYQSVAAGVEMSLVLGLEKIVVGDTQPDLTFVLDLPAPEGLARAGARRGAATVDRFESQDIAVHERIRAGFLAIAQSEPGRCAVVDATRPAATLMFDIRAIVRERLGQ